MMREFYSRTVKDKSYRAYPVGAEVGRWMRHLRINGHPQNTLDSYESTLAKLALDHADFESLDQFASPVGTEYLWEFIDRHWGQASQGTRNQRVSAIKSFFTWAKANGRISYDPTAEMKIRRARGRERNAYHNDVISRLIGSQTLLRDQIALELAGWLALRKNEIRLLRLRDVDLVRNLITVHGKGGKVVVLPLGFDALRGDLAAYMLDRHPDEYLLYPKNETRKPMTPSSVHRWFKRCLARAGLPDSMEMHELRHSAADHLWRVTGNIVLAQKLLRHESVGTTQTYLHPTREDLAAGLRAVEASWERN